INASNEIVNLCVGYVFESWEEIDKIIKIYDKREGFGVLTFIITAIVNRNDKGANGMPILTPQEIEIQFLTENGNLSIGTQKKLLKAKFPTESILDRNLSNIIQKFKIHTDEKLDASQQIVLWLKYYDVILNNNTAKTNCYQIPLSLFLIVDNNTRLRLVVQALVSNETTESYKWILECTKKVTMIKSLVFITDADPAADAAYSNVKDYLMRALYPSQQVWTRAFISKIFTAKIQTTSRVEDLNSIVKRLLTASSSLCDLVDALDARLQDEAQWNQFFEYQTMSSCMEIVSVNHDFFSEIDKKMSKYLTLHILSAERLEMSQCLYFDSNLIVTDGFVENSYDAKQILLKSIIAEVGKENVREWLILFLTYVRACRTYLVTSSVTIIFRQGYNYEYLLFCESRISEESTERNTNAKFLDYIQVHDLAVDYGNHSEMVAWLKEFIGWHKETAATLTGSVRNWNLQEPLEIQANDENKENEPGSIKNPLENHAHTPAVHVIKQDTIAQHVKIARFTPLSKHHLDVGNGTSSNINSNSVASSSPTFNHFAQ
ncbi:5743_t:CDS:10, partial [Ambispora gerdemannii]